MVKLSHGWQAHTIDQVESLASYATSPTTSSSNSTIHLHTGLSTSPQLSSAASASRTGSAKTTPALAAHHHFPADSSAHHPLRAASTSPVKSLAPPVTIEPRPHQPQMSFANSRRTSSVSRHQPPAFLARGDRNPSPTTPGPQPSPYHAHQHERTPGDPIVFSPHQNVREQDAIESLLFMSSPGNSANLKRTLAGQPTSSSQSLPSARRALPSGQRKSLPSGRPSVPAPMSGGSSSGAKRVGFEGALKHHDMMEVDVVRSGPGAAAKRKVGGANGGSSRHHAVVDHQHHHGHGRGGASLKHIPASAGLYATAAAPRPSLADEDIDRMMERMAEAAGAADLDSSDSEGEILIPARPLSGRREAGATRVGWGG